MRALLFMILPLFVFAKSYGLRELIDHANSHNHMVQSKSLNIKSKVKEIEAAKSAYWPTLDISAGHVLVDPNNLVDPGQTTSVSAIISMELYDGGRKNALLRAKNFEHKASLFEKRAFEKSIALDIINSYYTIRKLKATLYALQERSKELKIQIHRMKKFKISGLSTQEDVDKLQAAYDNNEYIVENTKLALISNEENLYLQSGLPAKYLKNNSFKEPKNVHFEPYEKIKILNANAQALAENANAIHAGYMPQVSVSDIYNRSHYSDTVNVPGMDGLLPEHQNRLMLSVNIRLFDHGKMKRDREAVLYQKMALDSQKKHAQDEQKMNFRIASERLRTVRVKLKSTKSALHASRSTYKTILKKFEVGMVDNITYLDALNNVTLSKARYKETLYDYEISKSIYYYYAGKNPKEFIR
jgi:outer membrane protein TolC